MIMKIFDPLNIGLSCAASLSFLAIEGGTKGDRDNLEIWKKYGPWYTTVGSYHWKMIHKVKLGDIKYVKQMNTIGSILFIFIPRWTILDKCMTFFFPQDHREGLFIH